MRARTISPEERASYEGWRGSDLTLDELVDDDFLTSHGIKPMRKPSKLRKVIERPMLINGAISQEAMRRIVARTGYPGVEAWSAHNKGAMRAVKGVLAHHTGTPWSAVGDYPTLRVVRDGRSGLVNSLSAFGLGKSGTIYLISNRLSWHAGAGNLNGITDGNGELLGIEAESDGGPGHWTPMQLDCYPRLVASILVEIRENRRFTGRHADFALPRGRKNDFAGWPGGPGAFWGKVDWFLAHPEQINKNFQNPPPATFPIIGEIAGRYGQPWVGSRLGRPLGPEVPTLDKTGRWQAFQNGAIYWYPGIGAHPLWGAFYDYFKANGYEFTLGYPVSGEFKSELTGRTTQGFQNGKLDLFPTGPVWTPKA